MPKTDSPTRIQRAKRVIVVRGRPRRAGRITAGGWKKKPDQFKVPMSRFWGGWRGKP
jgi:hypothetical protein